MQAHPLHRLHTGGESRASGGSGRGQRRVWQGREPPPGSQDCRLDGRKADGHADGRTDGLTVHKPSFHQHDIACLWFRPHCAASCVSNQSRRSARQPHKSRQIYTTKTNKQTQFHCFVSILVNGRDIPQSPCPEKNDKEMFLFFLHFYSLVSSNFSQIQKREHLTAIRRWKIQSRSRISHYGLAAPVFSARLAEWILLGGWMNPSPVLLLWAKSARRGHEPSAGARWQLGERVPSQASAAPRSKPTGRRRRRRRCHSGLDTSTRDLSIGRRPPAAASLTIVAARESIHSAHHCRLLQAISACVFILSPLKTCLS